MKQKIIPVLMSAMFTGYAFNSQAQANQQLSNLTSPTAINHSLSPYADSVKNLGSATKGWKDIYFTGGLFVDGKRFFKVTSPLESGSTFFGYESGSYTGNRTDANTGFGYRSLFYNDTGHYNTAVGTEALFSNVNGSSNIAVGYAALHRNKNGGGNNAIGNAALYQNGSGNNNAAMGSLALQMSSTGSDNVAIGHFAIKNNKIGNANVGIGANTLTTITTGTGNTALGYAADVNASNRFNATAIGYGAVATADNQVMLGNTSVTSVKAAGSFVIMSDGRFKKNIKEDVPGLAFINLLKPVTYNYDIHGWNKLIGMKVEKRISMLNGDGAIKRKEQMLYTGFVAQEVEKGADKLGYSFSGVYKPQNDKDAYGLSYADFVVPLVKAVQELSKKADEIEVLKKEVAELRQMIIDVKNVDINNSVPTSISSSYLEPIVPNPVKGTAFIRYHVPSNANSPKLVVTDMKGAAVKTFSLNLGSSKVTISSNALAAGTYTYSLWIGGKIVDAKQLVVTR